MEQELKVKVNLLQGSLNKRQLITGLRLSKTTVEHAKCSMSNLKTRVARETPQQGRHLPRG